MWGEEGCSSRGKDDRSVKQKEQATCIFPRSASTAKAMGFESRSLLRTCVRHVGK